MKRIVTVDLDEETGEINIQVACSTNLEEAPIIFGDMLGMLARQSADAIAKRASAIRDSDGSISVNMEIHAELLPLITLLMSQRFNMRVSLGLQDGDKLVEMFKEP